MAVCNFRKKINLFKVRNVVKEKLNRSWKKNALRC